MNKRLIMTSDGKVGPATAVFVPDNPSSKLAITIPYNHLRTLMLEYVDECNRAEAGKYHDCLELERQLTLSGFLVWLRNKQREC